jgi:ArsR family transcriptional regulator
MDHAQIEQISKALGDPTRLMIFEAIASREQMNCGEIVALQGVTPATVSHHLKALADAGLIESRREGQFIYNKALPQTMEEYTRALSRIMHAKKPVKRR